MKTPRNFLIATLGMVACLSSANAAVIALYDFEDSSLNSWDSEPNSSASAFSSGSGITDFARQTTGDNTNDPFTTSPATGGNGVDLHRGRFLSSQISGTTQTEAVAANDYLSFSISPDSGYTLSLESLVFKLSMGNATGSAEGYFVRSSVDTYATNLAAGTITVVRTSSGAYQLVSLDLSSPSFEDLTSTTEFRFYFYNPDGLNLTSSNSIDKVQLEGTLNVIPEPASGILLFFGIGLGLLGRIRRRTGY